MNNEIQQMVTARSPEDRLRRMLDATPEQQALVDHILEGRIDPKSPSHANIGEMLNKREVAARLKITVRTVENWQKRGVVPYIKVGKIVLFNWGDVLDSLKTSFRVCRKTIR